jgi:DNA adenine methylase
LSAPPLTYYGGKHAVAQRIVALLPPHRHYVEAFAGSLAVLLAKPQSEIETVNDLDERLVTFWRVLRDRPADLIRVCELTPHARAEQQCGRDASVDELEMARRIWVLLTQSRSAPSGRITGWRHFIDPRRDGSPTTVMPDYLDAYLDRMPAAAARLRRVSLECRPAIDVITRYGKNPDVLIYADPPYPASVRSHGNHYAHEMRRDDQHRELAEVLHAARAAVVLSGYACDLYDLELYPNWHRTEIASRASNAPSGARSRTEVLWSNRPLAAGDALFPIAEARGVA